MAAWTNQGEQGRLPAVLTLSSLIDQLKGHLAKHYPSTTTPCPANPQHSQRPPPHHHHPRPTRPAAKLRQVDEVTERSRFVRSKGRWLYLDSQFIEEAEADGEGAAKAEAGAAEKEKKTGFLGLF